MYVYTVENFKLSYQKFREQWPLDNRPFRDYELDGMQSEQDGATRTTMFV